MENIKFLQSGGYTPYKGSTYPNSEECAYFANLQLRDLGYKAYGNAWSRNGNIVYNGYTDSGYNGNDPNAHAKAAMNALYKNFDTSTLDPNKIYTVNMYYKGSKKLDEAYEDTDGNGLRGTHTGNLYYDLNSKKWKVQHNIHGTIHNDDWIQMQRKGINGGQYGPTGIQETETPRFWDKTKGVIKSWFKQEGGIMNYLDY